MVRIYVLPDGRALRAGEPFELNEIKYPANWLSLAASKDFEGIGISVTDEPDPEPQPDPAPNKIWAGDILDLFSAEDYAAIQTAIGDNLELRRWWETMLTRYEPIMLDNARFVRAWQALSGVLGAARCTELLSALRATAFQ